ncbi:MAG: cyclic nucleotide-binding domain-containing protein, partial [Candidatus Neomarinimicrobiota bacterium]|nr:cyclic nucleotide-binding domain-containing protein [Candidatus Neomarinimicrobiota bacterium]
LLFIPVLMSASFAKFSDQTFKFTINNSSVELLWLPVPPNIRKYIKPQIGGTVKAIAEGLSGLLVFFLVKIIELQFLSIIALGSIVVWLFTSIRVKANYVKQLQTAISKRQIDFEDLNVDVQDAAMVKTIEETLSSKDEIQQLFALEIIEGLPLSSWKNSLERLFKEGSVDVRKRILSMAWDEEFILSNEDIITTMKKDDDVAIEAIMVAGRRKLTEILPDLEPLLSADSLETRAAAAAAILLLEAGQTDKAESVLIEMLDNDDESTQATALNRLVYNNSILPQEKLIEFLKNEGAVISNVALTIAEKREEPELIPGIITNLDIPKARAQARFTLNKFPDDLVIEEFEKLLSSSDLSRKLRLGIIRALREYPNDKPIDMLLGQLDQDDQDVYNEVVDSLLTIARLHPFGEEKKAKITEEIRMIASRVYSLNESIKLIPDDDNKFLMYDYLNNEIQNTLPTLLKLGVIDIPDTPIETYIHTVKSGDPAKLPFLLEFFENIFSKEERDIINPLIEPISLRERSAIGHSHFKDLPNNLDTVITESVYSPNKWQSVIALDYLIKTEKMNVFKELDWSNVPATNANKELLTRTVEKNGTNLEFIPVDRFKLEDTELSMYSTLEKTIILKSVDLFKTIPAENLSRISQITEEVQFEANTPIFAEGDYGDSLFIVVNGNVKIHKGDTELVTLGKGSCLGEMALLDDEPRSADATVTEDSILFQIEQEGFYEVMGSQSDIMEGIIKLLTGRLRDANEKLMAK